MDWQRDLVVAGKKGRIKIEKIRIEMKIGSASMTTHLRAKVSLLPESVVSPTQ